MSLILKYLKKYFFLVLLIIGLTYAQVQSELALPDYMSDIVTNGVQYAGIKEEAPLMILEEDMNNLLIFMSSSEQERVLNNYVLMDVGSKVVVDNQEVIFEKATYYDSGEEDLSELLQKPILYAYSVSSSGLEVNQDNVEIVKQQLDESLQGLSDNYSSIVKMAIKQYYNNVGLSVEKLQTSYIWHVGKIMLLISLIGVLAQLISTYLATKIASKIASQLRNDVFEKVESFSSSEFSKFSTSSLITRTGNDITKVQTLIQMMLRMMLMAPIMGLTAVFKVIKYPSVSWLLLVAIGVMLGVLAILIIFAMPKFEIIQKLTDKLNNVMRESLDGILVIRAFNSEKQEEAKFDDVNHNLMKNEAFVSKILNIASPTMTIIMNYLTVFITWFSAKAIDSDVMSIGEMMAFIQYAMHVVMSFMFVTMTFFMIPRSLVSARRIKEVLDKENSIVDIASPLSFPETNGELRFNHVGFKYPGADEYVLKDINFSLLPEETLAIVGSTGSGKSSIVKLIPRLFDVSEGSITFNGQDIRNFAQKDLHEHIGYASQKAIMFSGSIKSNLEFGRQIEPARLDEAILVSQSANIIEEKENGLDSLINQGGSNVSGGQKQRLSIARALGEDVYLYIFDDSFSALDFETDKKLRQALNKLIQRNKASVIIVAQRISTIKNADKILVLDEGKVVGYGKHQELLKNCEVYKQIAYSQLSKEELA